MKGGDVHITQQATFTGALKAYASLDNPLHTLVEIVITPFSINKNKQAIPRSEASNITKTALNQPLKINFSDNKIHGHASSIPIGPIVHVEETDDVIKGRAIIWNDEFSAVAEYLKKATAENRDIGTSWEIYYNEATTENNVEYLHGCIYAACCIVQDPAYGNETLIRAIAEDLSKKKESETMEEERQEISNLMSMLQSMYCLLDEKYYQTFEIEEAEMSKTENLDSFSSRLTDLVTKLDQRAKDAGLVAEEAQTKLQTVEAELSTAQAEVETYRAEKAQAEKERVTAERKEKLSTAGIDESKLEFYLALPDDVFETVVQDVLTIKNASKEVAENKNKDKTIVPEPYGTQNFDIRKTHEEVMKEEKRFS